MKDFSPEIIYKTARSGGKGGQNVNKVETMVEARWLINASAYFSEADKSKLHQALAGRINSEGFLLFRSSASRSQLENKITVTQKIISLVNTALIPKKLRLAVKPTKASKERRIESKKLQGAKKANRRKDWE